MRVVYYGRELYHAATGAQRDNHQYIARIPVGDRFRYFYNQAELAAYNAGKNIQGATKEAVSKVGKAVGDAATKLKNRAYSEGLKVKYAGSGKKIHDALDNALSKRAYKGETVNKSVERQKNEAASKAAGTRKWDARVDGYSRHLENLNSSKTKRADGMHNLNREVTEKEKKQNASIKTGEEAVREARRKKDSIKQPNNQGIASTTGKNNAPKNNQGIASTNNSSKKVGINSQDIMKQDLSNKAKHPTNQGIVGKTYAEGRNRPKNNQGIAHIKDSGNAPKNNQGYIGQKSPKVSGKPLTGNSGKKYDSKKINNGTFSAGSGRLDNGTVDRFHVNTDQFKKHKTGSKLKSIEDSFYESYVKDGHDPEKARRWAKKAAENYMKKHK